MNLPPTVPSVASDLRSYGVGFATDIAAAATRHHIDPRLLAAVAAQETGGPGSNTGRNIVGDGGYGRGVFQIDDRYHAFARSGRAMNPTDNAEYAASMLSGLLAWYASVREALSAYNAGDPHARGTATTWAGGETLSYADSVLRHEASLGQTNVTDQDASEQPDAVSAVGGLATFALGAPPPNPEPRHVPPAAPAPYASVVDPDADDGASMI